jgi:hypothetical protein
MKGSVLACLALVAGSLVVAHLASASVRSSDDIIIDYTLDDASDAHAWVGLRNSDDQGTKFDLKVELRVGDGLVTSGVTRCIGGVTRNPASAKEVVVGWNPFSPVFVATGTTVSVRVYARIGTRPDGTSCGGHSGAAGVRLYYDAQNRPTLFGATIAGSTRDHHFHSDGAPCANAESTGVTTRFLDTTAPAGKAAKCKDSSGLTLAGGNPWKTVGEWAETLDLG